LLSAASLAAGDRGGGSRGHSRHGEKLRLRLLVSRPYHTDYGMRWSFMVA